MKVTFTWGDGPDMILETGDRSYDLSVVEAKNLIVQLEMAIAQCEDIEAVAKQHDDGLEKSYESPIINFFNKTGYDSDGRSLDDYLNADDHWMEHCHDYIQWLFPLREPSQFNYKSPLVNDLDIAYFNWAIHEQLPIVDNYFLGVEKYLNFIGIALFADGVRGTKDFHEKKHIWTGDFNHNHLRISRMLGSLSILGFNAWAERILSFMKQYRSDPMPYWESALNSE